MLDFSLQQASLLKGCADRRQESACVPHRPLLSSSSVKPTTGLELRSRLLPVYWLFPSPSDRDSPAPDCAGCLLPAGARSRPLAAHSLARDAPAPPEAGQPACLDPRPPPHAFRP
eukprot:98698-Rhodomonas_salina.2